MHILLTQPIHSAVPAEAEKLTRFAFSDPTVAPVTLCGLRKSCSFNSGREALVLLPRDWRQETADVHPHVAYHNGCFQFRSTLTEKSKSDRWVIISNARYITSFDHRHIDRLLTSMDCDLAAIFIDTSLSSNYEKIIYTSAGNVAGFCRL